MLQMLPNSIFSSPSAAALGELYFKKSVCVLVYNAFCLCLTSFLYLKELSDTRMMETTNVKTSEPHQPALVLHCYVIWLRSKWGSKLTYFSNFAIYYLLVQLRVKSRLKRRVVKWVYFHSQPFSNRLNWHGDLNTDTPVLGIRTAEENLAKWGYKIV